MAGRRKGLRAGIVGSLLAGGAGAVWAQDSPVLAPLPEVPATAAAPVMTSTPAPATVALSSGAVGSAGPVVPRRDTARSLMWRSFHDAGWDALRAKRYDLADELFRAGLKEAQKYGTQDPYLMSSYVDMAWVLLLKGRADEAEPLAQWAAGAREAHFGPFDARVGDTQTLLAKIAIARKQYDEAERYARRAVTIYFKTNFGVDDRHPSYALDVLGEVLEANGRLAEAQAIYTRALNLRESALNISVKYPYVSEIDVAASYRRLASVLRRLGQDEQADEFEARAEELDTEGAGGGAAPPANGAGNAPPANF